MCSYRTWFIKRWKQPGVFDRPNGQVTYSYNPPGVQKAVLCWLPSRILIWWRPLCKSSLLNIFIPRVCAMRSAATGVGKGSRKV